MVAVASESTLRGELQSGQSGGQLNQTRAQYEGRSSEIQLNKIVSLSAIGAGAALLTLGLVLNSSSDGAAVALVPTAHGVALAAVLP